MSASNGSDVVVVGAGVAGAATAHALVRRGATVTLLDAPTAGRASAASAGGLWPLGESLGLGCGVILHATQGGGGSGPEPLPRGFMDFLCAGNDLFPTLAGELRTLVDVDIEAESGTGLLYLIYDAAQEAHARGILEHVGGERATWWTPQRVRERDPAVTGDLLGAVHFPGDNQVNPMLLAEGLKRAAVAGGGRFVAEARVTGFRAVGDRLLAVLTEGGEFPCDAVVNAAGAWAGALARLAGTDIPIVPVRGQIVCTETLRPGSLRSNLSTRDCYILQKAHGEVIVGSTTEHAGFDPSVRYDSLRALAAGAIRAVPGLASVKFKRAWAGLRPGTPDELPILGPDPKVANLFHAAGGFRTGIVAAPLSGDIVAACVTGQEPPCPVAPYLASRFPDTVT